MKHNLCSSAFLIGGLFLIPFIGGGRVNAQSARIVINAPSGVSGETLQQENLRTLTVHVSGNSVIESNDKYIKRGVSFSQSLNDVYSGVKTKAITLNFRSDMGAWVSPMISLRTLKTELGLRNYEVSYRFYDPHFILPKTGKLSFDAENTTGVQNVIIDQLENCKRVTFNPVIDRDGKTTSATLAPDLKTGVFGAEMNVNTVEIQNEAFSVYAAPGEKVRYVISPNNHEYALHADSIVVGDADRVIDTDYRNAVKCRLYINDSKGKPCCVVNAQGVSSTFYQKHPLAPAYGYGSFYGRLCGLQKNVDNRTIAIYALPGTQYFQLYDPVVETCDEDFMTPYNASNKHVIKSVTVTNDAAEQDVVLGVSQPLRDHIVLHGAAKYADKLTVVYGGTYVSDFDPKPTNNPTYFRMLEKEIVGDDGSMTTLVNTAASMYYNPICLLSFKNQNDTIREFMNAEFIDASLSKPANRNLTEKDFKVWLAGAPQPLDFKKIYPVRFVAPCVYFADGNKIFMGLKGANLYNSKEHTHHDGCVKPIGASRDPLPNDTITYLLPEGSYFYYSGKTRNEYLSENDSVSSFFVGNSDNHVFRIKSAQDFSFVRLKDAKFACDTVFYRGETELYYNRKQYKKEETAAGTKYNKYLVNRTFPVKPGYNEFTLKFHEIVVESDSVGCYRWLQSWNKEWGDYSEGFIVIERPSREYSDYKKGHIYLEEHSEADLIVGMSEYSSDAGFYRYPLSEISKDTTISIGFSGVYRVRFFYKDKLLSNYRDELKEGNLELIDLTRNAHVLTGYSNLLYRGYIKLLPGKYRFRAQSADGFKEDISFDVVFTIDHSCSIRLEQQETSIGEVTMGDKENLSEKAYYTIDGRRITRPQRGLNLIRMSDGSLRKVFIK